MRILSAMSVLLAALAPPATAQQVLPSAAEIPEEVLYQFFFFRVAWLEQSADEQRAKGADDSVARSLIRKQFQLSAGEESALKHIALDWSSKHQAILTQAQAVAETVAGPEHDRQMLELKNQKKRNVLEHVAQLRSAFGPERFRQFDQLVRGLSRVNGPGILRPPRR